MQSIHNSLCFLLVVETSCLISKGIADIRHHDYALMSRILAPNNQLETQPKYPRKTNQTSPVPDELEFPISEYPLMTLLANSR